MPVFSISRVSKLNVDLFAVSKGVFELEEFLSGVRISVLASRIIYPYRFIDMGDKDERSVY